MRASLLRHFVQTLRLRIDAPWPRQQAAERARLGHKDECPTQRHELAGSYPAQIFPTSTRPNFRIVK